MPISVVQSRVINQGGYSGSFGVNVTAGNSVILVATGAVFAAIASSSNPTFAGSPVTGAVKLYEIESAGGATGGGNYTTAWLLPNVAGGSAAVAITITNVFGGNFGLFGYEVSGLGATPTTGPASTGTAESGTALSSGSITPGAAIIIGSGACLTSTSMTGPTSPWTTIAMTGNDSLASSQVSAGGAVTWQATAAASTIWTAGIAAIAATGGGTAHTATASLTVTPSRSVSTVHGHFRTASLTVVPVRSNAVTQQHVRAASLTVTPVRQAVRHASHIVTANLSAVPSVHATGVNSSVVSGLVFRVTAARTAWLVQGARTS